MPAHSQNVERPTLAGRVTQEGAQLIARQQEERKALQTNHSGEWRAFNRRRIAQPALSPTEKAQRAQFRQQSADQHQSRSSPSPPRGRRLNRTWPQ